MHCIRKSMLSHYSAKQMYDLVDDVENYPRFMPWCGGVEVHERNETSLDVTLHIHFLGVRSFFRTRNRREANRQVMQLADGPFQHLKGHWQFTPLAEDACKVEFMLEYAFASTMLEKIIGPAFDRIIGSFVDAFIAEAERRYG